MPVVLANVLQPLIDVFEPVLVFFHDSVGFGWGFSIVALTIVVRVALLPLTLKQFKSMQNLQRLSPEIKELNEKYKDDRERKNQEMMKFYQENKVNPLGSCLPLLLQMPVFLALFYLLQKDLRLEICHQSAKPCGEIAQGSAEFLFIPDITTNATGGVLVVLILAYVGSQLGASLLMSVSADKNQRRLIVALPLIFVAFIINFPAGLIVYWITTNLWTVLQQYIVKRTVGPLRPPEATPAAAAADAGKGGSAVGRAFGRGKPEPVAADGDSGASRAPAGPPPPPPRRKKKRSGRRR